MLPVAIFDTSLWMASTPPGSPIQMFNAISSPEYEHLVGQLQQTKKKLQEFRQYSSRLRKERGSLCELVDEIQKKLLWEQHESEILEETVGLMKEKWNQMKFYEETVNAGKGPSFSRRKLYVSSQNFDPKIFREKIEGRRDFIGFSSVKKAALCCQKGLLSQRAAEIVFDIPRPRIKRALQAMREDHEIGKRGQP